MVALPHYPGTTRTRRTGDEAGQHQRHALQQLLHDITRLRRQTPPTELATRLVLDHHIFITEAELRWLDTVDETQLRAQLAQHPVSAPLTASSAALTATIQ